MSFLDKMKDKAKNIDFDGMKDRAKDMANNTKEKMKEIDVKETWNKTKDKFSRFSNQAELTLKLSDINEEFLSKDENDKKEKEENDEDIESKEEKEEVEVEKENETEEIEEDKAKKVNLREMTINLNKENKRMVINTFEEDFVANISLNNDFNDKIFNLIDLNINYKITNISLEDKKVKLAFDLDNLFEKYLENIL